MGCRIGGAKSKDTRYSTITVMMALPTWPGAWPRTTH